jgi:tripartite ATP-independent transporter DctP family solute receptor
MRNRENETMKHLARYGAVLAVGAMLALGSAGGVAAKTKIILSNDTQALSLKGKTFEVLKKSLEERLGNGATVELHQGGTLFSQKTQIQGVQLGGAHIISPTAGIYSSVAPKVNALLLPFLLSNPKAIDAAMKDDVVKTTFEPDFAKKNLKAVAIWVNGPRNIGYKQEEPILTPAGMKGLKIRVQSAPIFVETMKALGANVIAMSWGEVPTALQQGVIDAAEPTPNAWVASKLYEMVKNITLNGYVYSFYIVGANKSWWDGLSADVRKGVQAALEDATHWNWRNAKKLNDEANKKIHAAGVKLHTLTPAQRQKWIDAMAPVWKKLGTDVVGDKVMARLREIAKETP